MGNGKRTNGTKRVAAREGRRLEDHRGNMMEEIFRKYLRAWLDVEIETVRATFSEDAIYSECYGPEYRGLPQIMRWFKEWNERGKVLEWSIRRVIERDRTIVAEWYFKCEYDGVVDGFNGVTIADFDEDMRISRLSEFQSKAEHCCPYGE